MYKNEQDFCLEKNHENDVDFASLRTLADERPLMDFEYILFLNELADVLSTMPLREQEVLIKRFGLFGSPVLTLKKLGELYKVTAARIRAIEAKALRRLRHPKRAKRLIGFLDLNR